MAGWWARWKWRLGDWAILSLAIPVAMFVLVFLYGFVSSLFSLPWEQT